MRYLPNCCFIVSVVFCWSEFNFRIHGDDNSCVHRPTDWRIIIELYRPSHKTCYNTNESTSMRMVTREWVDLITGLWTNSVQLIISLSNRTSLKLECVSWRKEQIFDGFLQTKCEFKIVVVAKMVKSWLFRVQFPLTSNTILFKAIHLELCLSTILSRFHSQSPHKSGLEQRRRKKTNFHGTFTNCIVHKVGWYLVGRQQWS